MCIKYYDFRLLYFEFIIFIRNSVIICCYNRLFRTFFHSVICHRWIWEGEEIGHQYISPVVSMLNFEHIFLYSLEISYFLSLFLLPLPTVKRGTKNSRNLFHLLSGSSMNSRVIDNYSTCFRHHEMFIIIIAPLLTYFHPTQKMPVRPLLCWKTMAQNELKVKINKDKFLTWKLSMFHDLKFYH